MEQNFLNLFDSSDVKSYFLDNNIKEFKFEHYVPGNHKLGGLIEVCVKMSKRLLFGAIRNNVVEFRDFEVIVANVIHLLNRRPVAFKEALRHESINNWVPSCFTPEILLRGLNWFQWLYSFPEHLDADVDDPDWLDIAGVEHIRDSYDKLTKAKSYILAIFILKSSSLNWLIKPLMSLIDTRL